MPRATIHIGLPLGGVNRQNRKAVPPPTNMDQWAAWDIVGWRFRNEYQLRPLPSVLQYGVPNDFLDQDTGTGGNQSFRVTRLHNIRWGDGSFDIVRHSRGDPNAATGFNGFGELASGQWVSRSAAVDCGQLDTPHFGSALCPGNNGKGYYIFSNRSVGPYKWDGTAGDADATWTGTPLPSRFVVAFADRGFLFNQLDGGTVRTRQGQWSVAGDSSTWTGTGSGVREFTEFDGEITGAAAIRNQIFVYSARGIVAGNQTFDPVAPVSYTPIITNGIGNWAPDSLVSHSDIHAFLSQEGFFTWDGQQFENIGAPIDHAVLSNIDRNNIDKVTGIANPVWHMVMWAVPTQGNDAPDEIWAYDYRMKVWYRWPARLLFGGTSRVTSFALVDQTESTPWSSLAGTWAAQTSTWLGYGGQSTRPVLITGHEDGAVNQFDETVSNSAIEQYIESPDFFFRGTQLFEGDLSLASRRRAYAANESMITLDRVEISYRSLGNPGAANNFEHGLSVYISTDGGSAFTSFGTIAMPYSPGQTNRVVLFGRLTLDRQFRIKISNRVPRLGTFDHANIFLEDISLEIRRSGDEKAA